MLKPENKKWVLQETKTHGFLLVSVMARFFYSYYWIFLASDTTLYLPQKLYSLKPRRLKSKPEQRHLNHSKKFINSVRCTPLDVPLLINIQITGRGRYLMMS